MLKRSLLASLFLPIISMGADFYVATSGNDSNPGTLAQPFATIQHAVEQSVPGSTLFLREGTYRQTIDLDGVAGLPGQPVTLKSYQGEQVIIDGTIEITSTWTLDSETVYRTTIPEDITQLFVDDKIMTLARFPNAPAFSDAAFNEHNRREQLASSTHGTVRDNPNGGIAQSLADTGIDFTDCVALLNFGDHVTGARIVQNHTAGSSTFNYSPNINPFKNTRGYFFEGGIGNAERVMLDTPEEWAYDESTKTLYLWPEDGQDPSGRVSGARISLIP